MEGSVALLSNKTIALTFSAGLVVMLNKTESLINFPINVKFVLSFPVTSKALLRTYFWFENVIPKYPSSCIRSGVKLYTHKAE